MLSRKKRDAKFLIFQSLYIIAIAILFYKGTDLSLNKVQNLKPGYISLDTSKSKVYNPLEKVVLEKPQDSSEYKEVSREEIVVTKDTIQKLKAEISKLEKQKTPDKNVIDKTEKKVEPDQTVDDPFGKKVKKNNN